jgi:hypothetical protein
MPVAKLQGRIKSSFSRSAHMNHSDRDLDGLIAGIHFDAKLRALKIYFMSTIIAATDYGVRLATDSPWLPEFAAQPQSARVITEA